MAFRLTKSRIFLICCLAFIAGTGLASFLPSRIWQNAPLWFIFAMAFLLLSIFFWTRPPIRISALAGLFLFLAIWRYGLALPVRSADAIQYYNSSSAVLVGIIEKEPDIRSNHAKFEIGKIRLSQQGNWRELSGKLLVSAGLYPEYDYGDELRLECELRAPEAFKDFAYDRYLARYNIYSICNFPRVELLRSGQGNAVYSHIFRLKRELRQTIENGLGSPAAGLARGILLGDQKALDSGLSLQFQHLGLSHIVAISGMNISFLATVMMALLVGIGLHRRWAFYLSGLFLALFVILVGAPASAVRAGLMGFLILWALHIGRLNRMANSLILTAAIMLAINPLLLRYDAGFQLSFLALLGILYIYPRGEDLWNRIKWRKTPDRLVRFLRGSYEAVLLTLSAQILTLPVMAYDFGLVSLIAPGANLLILWTQAPIMILGLSAIGLSMLLPGAVLLFFLPLRVLLAYILWIVEILDHLPYTYLVTDIRYVWLVWAWIVLYYALIIYALLRRGSVIRGKTDRKNNPTPWVRL